MRACWNMPALAALAAALSLVTPPAVGATVTLAFEGECLDLETGAVEVCLARATEPTACDVRVAFHADRAARAVLLQDGADVAVASLPGRAYADVTADDVAAATFTTAVVDEPFDDARVILVETSPGVVYKLGNVIEGPTSVTFDHEQLTGGQS